MELTLSILLILALGAVIYFLAQKLKKAKTDIKLLHSSLERYQSITDIEKAVEAKAHEVEEMQKELEKAHAAKLKEIEEMHKEMEKARDVKVMEIEAMQKEMEVAREAKLKEMEVAREVKLEKIAAMQREMEKLRQIKLDELGQIQQEADEMKSKYQSGRELMERLENELRLYESELDIIDFGIYKPTFDLDTSEEYKEALTQIVNKQKELIKRDSAAICTTTWTVGGSEKQGENMIRRYIKLMLRAFNGEADSLIAKVKWNNIARFEERIKRAHEAINQLGKTNQVHITDKYLQLKLDELHLTHELEQKKHEEKEEQRLIREQMREEEKAQRELERAQKEAEEEERRFERALEQAQKKLEKAQGEELDQLNNQILELQLKLEQAHEARERAISRAQMTRSGHVYIISNIGSFGEDKYKIGMTRRIEPLDRVKELGDASVPFEFDIHAMIYSDDAPALENTLHRIFNDRRVNMINTRKEFFNVSLEEIEKVIKESTTAEIHITKVAEAREFRETLALLKKPQVVESLIQDSKFAEYPEALFQ